MTLLQSTALRSLTRDLLDDAAGLPTSTFSPFQSSENRPYLHLDSDVKTIPWDNATPVRRHNPHTIVYADVYSPYYYDHSSSSSSNRSSPTSATGSPSSSESDSPTQPLFPLYPPLSHHPFLRSRPNLRRKESPRIQSLRQLRAKASESELQTIYEKQTLSYVDDSAFITPEPASMPAFRLLLTVPETSAH
jgi:hypothetical protein